MNWLSFVIKWNIYEGLFFLFDFFGVLSNMLSYLCLYLVYLVSKLALSAMVMLKKADIGYQILQSQLCLDLLDQCYDAFDILFYCP